MAIVYRIKDFKQDSTHKPGIPECRHLQIELTKDPDLAVCINCGSNTEALWMIAGITEESVIWFVRFKFYQAPRVMWVEATKGKDRRWLISEFPTEARKEYENFLKTLEPPKLDLNDWRKLVFHGE